MAEAQPTMVPAGTQTTIHQGSGIQAASTEAPNRAPPAGAGVALPPAADQQLRTAPPTMQSAPSLSSAAAGTGAGVSAWNDNKRIDALWTINQDRNSWMGVVGLGWRKLAPGNETSLSAMTMLAAHARATGAPVYYRDESDSLVHEMYVW